MIHLAASEVIKSILDWLQGNDDSNWRDKTMLLSETISELRQISRPIQPRVKTGSRSVEPHVISPQAMRINTVLPHLYKMTYAMQRRNRTAAIEYGKLALEVLSKST